MIKPGIIRFSLALMVILYHVSNFVPLGGFAVNCFFIMSGYWISVMYENKYLLTSNTLKVFYISRIWRLLPTFYCFTVCALILNWQCHTVLWKNLNFLKHDTYQFVLFITSNLTFLGYNQSNYRLLAPAWSLDIEMQFYLIFPFILFFFRGKKQMLIIFTFLFFLLSIFLEIFCHRTVIGRSLMVFLYLFLLGIIIYEVKLRFGNITEKLSLSLFALLILLQSIILPIKRIGLDTYSIAYILVLSKLQLIFVLPTLTNSVYNKSDKRDKFFGDISYIIYIAHWVWIIPYNLLINHSANKFIRIPYVMGFLTVTFLSSLIVYKFIDRPLEALRRKWVDSHLIKK